MLKPAVPLAAFTWNLSSMDLIAPPPLGRLIWGMVMEIPEAFSLEELLPGLDATSF